MNIEKKLTAMQELMNSFDDYQRESQNVSIAISKLKEVIEKEYLKKEKQQTIDVCVEFGMNNDTTNKERGEQYYNQTFKN